MIWSRQSPAYLVSDAGYKIARFKVFGDNQYRASFGGQWIGLPLSDLDEAKAACAKHKEQTQ